MKVGQTIKVNCYGHNYRCLVQEIDAGGVHGYFSLGGKKPKAKAEFLGYFYWKNIESLEVENVK